MRKISVILIMSHIHCRNKIIVLRHFNRKIISMNSLISSFYIHCLVTNMRWHRCWPYYIDDSVELTQFCWKVTFCHHGTTQSSSKATALLDVAKKKYLHSTSTLQKQQVAASATVNGLSGRAGDRIKFICNHSSDRHNKQLIKFGLKVTDWGQQNKR